MVRIKYGVEVSDILICRNKIKIKNLLSNDKSLTENKNKKKQVKRKKRRYLKGG